MSRIERGGVTNFYGYCEKRGVWNNNNRTYGIFYRARKPSKMEGCLFLHLYGERPKGQFVQSAILRKIPIGHYVSAYMAGDYLSFYEYLDEFLKIVNTGLYYQYRKRRKLVSVNFLVHVCADHGVDVLRAD